MRPIPALDTIRSLRRQGHAFRYIADHLNAHGVPTQTGYGQWNPGTVLKLLRRANASACVPTQHPQHATGHLNANP